MEAKLVELPNLRRYRRIRVGSGYSVGFRINGTVLRNIPISVLGAGGCLALLPRTVAANVHRGYLLMDFTLEHEDLQGEPFCSRVAYVTEDDPQVPRESVGLGIAFLSTSLHFYEWMDSYVAAHSGDS